MRIKMRGRVRNVTNKVGRTLILLGKAEEARPEPARTYKRRDVVTRPALTAEKPKAKKKAKAEKKPEPKVEAKPEIEADPWVPYYTDDDES